MHFDYKAYIELVNVISSSGYNVANYHNWNDIDNPVIYRHDIDNRLDKAVRLAQIESEQGIQSTYFVLISSDFYNALSKSSVNKILEIQNLGHEIGLHFDETQYEDTGNVDDLVPLIHKEAGILSDIVNNDVSVVSMHCPSRGLLDSNLQIPGMINSYCKTFFSDFKYLSDSTRRWREPAIDIIKSKKYDKLHILTHAFWYSDVEENLVDTVKEYVEAASMDRYEDMKVIVPGLESIYKYEK